MTKGGRVDEAFALQARWCRQMGAPRSAAIVAALPAALDRATATGRTVLGWPGEPVADALALRLLGGLHASARAGTDAGLTSAFANDLETAELVAILRAVVHAHDAALLPWLDRPPQTNEVARSAALLTGLLHLAARFGPRVELLEIGSSAGLNLALGAYRFILGDVTVGPVDAALTLTPDWRGPSPPAAGIEVVSARGVDLAPIDLADETALARLQAYVWVDHHARSERLAAAVAVARAMGVSVERGDAAEWLETRLGEPQPAGVTRVLMHSVVWQYLPDHSRRRIEAAMADAAARAHPERPLGWV